jgi:hypothetical protein
VRAEADEGDRLAVGRDGRIEHAVDDVGGWKIFLVANS